MADAKKTAKKTAPKAAKQATEVKTVAQLKEELAALQVEHRESRRSHRSGDLVNPRVLNTQRKSIARAYTALNQAERAEAKSAKEEN